MAITHYTSKRGKRESNEDGHSCKVDIDRGKGDPISFYGVYDGHGGKFVSKFLENNLPEFFTHQKVKYPLKKQYVNLIYDQIENVLYTKYESKVDGCGSTCLVACQYKYGSEGDEYIDVMNTGDSRLVSCDMNYLARALTLDHKPNLPMERRRLLKLGAKVVHEVDVPKGYDGDASEHRPELPMRGGKSLVLDSKIEHKNSDTYVWVEEYPEELQESSHEEIENEFDYHNGEIWNDRGTWRIQDLSVSRAFGDKSSQKYVVSTPDMYTYKITGAMRFMIMACDGLWDVMTNQDAVDFVIDTCYDESGKNVISEMVELDKNGEPKLDDEGNTTPMNAALQLANHAVNNLGSSDNVTIIVVFFDV